MTRVPGRPHGRHLLYLAEIVIHVGGGMFWVAMVAELSREQHFELLMSAMILARFAPRALLSAAFGRLADRVALRPLLVGIDVVRTALMGLLAALVMTGASPWALIACVATFSVVSVPTRVATTVALVRLCAEDQLAGANATLNTIGQIMGFAGPVVGAGVAAWSIEAALVSNAAGYAVSALLMASLRGLDAPGRARPERRRGADRRRHRVAVPGFGGLVALIGAVQFLRGAETALHVLVISEIAGAAPERIGLVSGAIGLGALVTTPIAARLARTDRVHDALLVSIALTALPTAVVAAVAAASGLTAACAVLFPVGVGMVVFEVLSVVTIQRATPRDELGRTFGVVNTAGSSGKLAGALAVPALVAGLGTAWSLVTAACVVAIVGAVVAPRVGQLVAAADERRRTLAPIADALRSLALFASALQVALERIAAAVVPMDVAAGATIVREGDAPDDLYVVRSGTFAVTVRGNEINRVGADEWFGEIGLVRRTARTATVSASEPATVWRIPGDAFVAALDESGPATSVLDAGIADRLARGAA